MIDVARKYLWTSEEAERATGGFAPVPWRASGVSIDTRTLIAGDLFIALKGPNFDGHDYALDALSKGAAAVVIEDCEQVEGNEHPVLKVSDTMKALEALAVASRQRTRASMIAVTGSVGKTGCKELLKFCLARQADVTASEGSLNNHWGLPLSLTRISHESSYGVLEMGMNHSGEIEPLTRMARPHVAMITTVESVHSAHFSGIDEIADAKAEIFLGVEPDGVAVLNCDNDSYDRLVDAAKAAGVENILTFGASDDADFRLLDVEPEAGGIKVRARIEGKDVEYRLGLPGRHWAMNSLGVLACISAAGGKIPDSLRAFADFSAPKGRGRKHYVDLPNGGFLVIDESYNASPVSMRAAFDVLSQTQPGPGGRRIAVLGDMLELGGQSAERHAGLAKPLLASGVDLVFTAGQDMCRLYETLPETVQGQHAENSGALRESIKACITAGDVIVVKGSAGSRMNIIVDSLLALASDVEGQAQRVVNGG